MKSYSRIIRTPFIAAGSLIVTSAAMAQSEQIADEDIDMVIVTATKRASTLQDVPFSINAQTAEDIARTGAASLEDISRNVAGLTVQNLGPGQSQVAIRGVSAGQIVRDQPGVKEQVGVYLDESVISTSLFTPDLDLFDLARVETLRGPQGTLFGSGSVGGTIRYITNQPNAQEFEGALEVNGNSVTDGGLGGHIKAMVNAPIVEDVLAVRAVGYHTEYAGFIDALTRGGTDKDINDGSRSGGRLAVLFRPTPDIEVVPRVLYQNIDTNGFNREETFNIFANPDTLAPDTLGERQQFLQREEGFDDVTFIADLTAKWSVGPVEVVSISTYTDREIDVLRDGSAVVHSISLDLNFDLGVTDSPVEFLDVTDYESFTQELRLASTGDGPFQWLIGGFYADIDRGYGQNFFVTGYDDAVDGAFGAGVAEATRNGIAGVDEPFRSDLLVTLEQTAIFGEASFDFTDQLTLTFGGRYYDFEEARTITTGGVLANGDTGRVDETSSSGFNPRVILSYDVNDTVTVNAQAAQGFRLGGVNDPLNTPACSAQDLEIFGGFQDYDDEKLWNYEAGLKAQSGSFTFNTAVFYNDISDLQVTLDAGSCSSRIVFNAPEAHSVGIEYEVGFSPLEGLELFLSGSFIEAEFDSSVRDGSGAIIAGLEEGNRLPTVPEFQMSASAVYSWPAQWFGSDAEAFFAGSIQHVGSRFTQPSDQTPTQGLPNATNLVFGGFDGTENPRELINTELDDYTLLNFQTGVNAESYSILMYVNNVFDENAQLSFDRERGGRARLGYLIGQPRTVGLTARYRF